MAKPPSIHHVVTAFLTNQGRILVVKRSEKVKTSKRKWAGISGYLEDDDKSPVERALKEIREETGIESSSLKLLREGETVRAYDREHQRIWVVHPFLFETSRSDVKLDWENTEFRWIEPQELQALDPVPKLNETLDRVIAPSLETIQPSSATMTKINEIRNDRLRGAFSLAIDALTALKVEVASLEGRDANNLFWQIRRVSFELMNSRPSMSIISNSVAHVLWKISEARSKIHDAQTLASFALAEIHASTDALRSSHRKAAQLTANELPEQGVVVTNSFSSTVFEALEIGHQLGKGFEVACMESRPRFEGRRLAVELAKKGIPVSLVVDAAVDSVVRNASVAITGADSVLRGGSVVNKSGTASLARSASDFAVPFLAACEGMKLNVRNFLGEQVRLEEADSSEVADPAEIPGAKAKNVYFDITPSRYVSKIILDDGPHRPSEVEELTAKLAEQVYF